MVEQIDSQIPLAENHGSLRVIARAATNIAAFVGRALKGPVNEPVPIRSFADYTRVFGGLWQPSTMSYAVEQFFENGGRCAVIVRVVNGARPPTLTLPTASGKLILRGVGAGSREFLRASVDYDAIEPKETDKHFFQMNALAYWQRIRAAQFGYMSVTESIQDNYDLIKQILESYGITMTRRQVRASVERIREEDIEESADVLTQEVPTRKLSVA